MNGGFWGKNGRLKALANHCLNHDVTDLRICLILKSI